MTDRNFGAEIWDRVGSIDGGRIVLNALPSRVIVTDDELFEFRVREIEIVIDDNNAPRERTILRLVTKQSNSRGFNELMTLGGIVNVSVERMTDDGQRIFGTVQMLKAATAGGSVEPPYPAELKHSPEMNALVSPVFNSQGEVVWFHALCLNDGGKKASAVEKRRRIRRAMKQRGASTTPWHDRPAAKSPSAHKIALQFINKNGEQLICPIDIKPEAIEELRHVPERVPPGMLEPGETLVDFIMRSLVMLVDGHREAHDLLTAEAWASLSAYLMWYVIWQRDDKELQQRAPHESFYATFQRHADDDQYIDCYVHWGELPVPEGAEPLLACAGFVEWFALPMHRTARNADRLQRELKEEFGISSVEITRFLAEISGGLSSDGSWTLRNAIYDEQQKTWLCRRLDSDGIYEWATLHANGTWGVIENAANGLAWWQRIVEYWGNKNDGVTHGGSIDPRDIRQFALLAAKVQRMLADPAKLSFPVEFINAFAKWGIIEHWTPAVKRRLFAASCAKLAVRLREAHKFVFDHMFSRLVVEAAEQDPATIERALITARLPFENCWIEWDRSTSIDRHRWEAGHDRWGMLISPTQWPDIFEIVVVIGDNPSGTRDPRSADQRRGLAIVPGALLVNFREPISTEIGVVHVVISDPTDSGEFGDEEQIMGYDYYERWKSSRAALMKQIAQHGRFIIDALPYDPPIVDILQREYKADKGAFARGDGSLQEYLGLCSLAVPGVFREAIAGCALVATHVGGGPLVKELAAKTKTSYYSGRFHPAIEYKVLQLARPMPAPHLWRKVFRKKPSGPVRWHQVIGSWHHRRAPNAQCDKHPRACPIAVWNAVEPREEPSDGGHPLTEVQPDDIQACILCKRHRWFVKDHARGDVREGMLEKDYEITATEKARSAS
jgi:hypothetical protein